MAAAAPKQYLPLAGRTLIEWSLSTLLDADWVEGVVVALAPEDARFSGLACAADPRVLCVAGGDSRAASVLAALALIEQRSERADEVFVLVHDAARPCLPMADLVRLRDSASDADGGLLAAPVSDTLKSADGPRVASTLDRSRIQRALTPQMFRLDLLSSALRNSLRRRDPVTDDASAMEQAGYRPRLVQGDPGNLKVTYPDDLRQAEWRLAQGRSGT